MLWFRKVDKKEFDNFKKIVKKSFASSKHDVEKLNSIIGPIPKQFTDLQKQLTEHLMSSVSSVKSSVSSLRVHREVSELTKNIFKDLTPHTQKAFVLVTRLLNETSEEWIPLSSLTQELYPTKEAAKVRNTLSNTLKPLFNNKLLERKREANFVYVKLTEKGFKCVKTELSKTQLKNIAKFYNH